jgi:GH18 family chitinase
MTVLRISLGCLLGLILIGTTSVAAEPATEAPAFRIAGYLPEYRAADLDLSAARDLTDLILFSADPSATGQLDLSRLKHLPWAKLRAFKTRRRVRLILCVGGWERSNHFPAVVASDPNRQEFVNSAVQVCLDRRLDGVDLDWEHPRTEAEERGYGKLLADLRKAFAPQGLILSVTIAAWQRLPREAFDHVDWVNLMAYDHPGRHSTFEAAQADVQQILRAGAPARKIALGLPFYGRDTTRRQRTLSYREIVAQHHPRPEIDEVGDIYFNGPTTIRRKTEYAIEAGLAGIMIWELGQDAPGEQALLTVIRSARDRSQRR